MTDLSARLGRVRALAPFTDDQRKTLSGFVSVRRVSVGDPVFSVGEAATEAFVIERGQINIQRPTSYGCFVLRELGTGALFGETGLLERPAHSAEAVAASNVDLLALDAVALDRQARDDQSFQISLLWALWRSLSEKLRLANGRLGIFFDEVSRGSAPSPPAPTPGEAVRVGISAKRDLFEEQKLSPMEINFLATLSREERFAPGQVIFRESEPGDAAYVVLEGRVMISKSVSGAGEEALAFLERGSYFGEMALIDRLPRSATARAHGEETVVLAVAREVLAGILDVRRVSAARLLQLLCGMAAGRLLEVEEKLVGWHVISAGAA